MVPGVQVTAGMGICCSSMDADVINLKAIQPIITDDNHGYYSSQSTTDLLWKLLFISLFYYSVYSKEINKLFLVNFILKDNKLLG